MQTRTPDNKVMDLPAPDADAAAHSAQLAALIRDAIKTHGGRIDFAQFMQLALYAPGLGYYTAGAHKFGEAGDFVTAPEISPLFSQCVARQCQQVIEALGTADILEFGAGSGVMAADILTELECLQALPGHYYILEISPELRARQRATLAQHVPQLLDRVQWLDTLPNSFTGVVLANEVLDAMPVHRVCINKGVLKEQFVSVEQGEFCWVADAPSTEGLEAQLPLSDLPDGYCTEVNLAAPAWVASVSHMLVAGAILAIDYGYPRSEYYHPQRHAGTLLCHYRHRAHADPFVYPGLQDITAHVDFSAIAHAADSAGLEVAGFTTQAHFLMACGLDRVIANSGNGDLQAQMTLSQQIKRLTLPSEMGEVFKVLAVTRQLDIELRGFALQDFRHRL